MRSTRGGALGLLEHRRKGRPRVPDAEDSFRHGTPLAYPTPTPTAQREQPGTKRSRTPGHLAAPISLLDSLLGFFWGLWRPSRPGALSRTDGDGGPASPLPIHIQCFLCPSAQCMFAQDDM